MDGDLDGLFKQEAGMLEDTRQLEFQSNDPLSERDLGRIQRNIDQIEQYRRNQTNTLRVVQRYSFDAQGSGRLRTSFYKQIAPGDPKLVTHYVRGGPANRKLVYQQMVDERRQSAAWAAEIGVAEARRPRRAEKRGGGEEDNNFEGKTYFITQGGGE